jgi:IS5 family transposase
LASPLTAAVTAANVADVTMLAAVVDDLPPVRTPSGRRRVRPGKVHADKGYDSQANRAWLRRRGVRPRIARRGMESSTRLGRHRWRVERSLSWPGLLQAAAGALGPGFGAVVRVRPAGRCGRLLQPV